MADIDPRELNIDTFKEQFKTGARAYMFWMEPHFPRLVQNSVTLSIPSKFLVRSTTLPASSFAEIRTNWVGFAYKAAGARVYGDWTVQFTCDVEGKIRLAFLEWQKLMLNPQTNVHTLPKDYFVDQQVTLLNVTNMNKALRYNLHFAWPKDVGDLSLAYGETSDYANFRVTFSYTYHTYESA